MGALSVFFLMGILSTLFLIFVSLFIGILCTYVVGYLFEGFLVSSLLDTKHYRGWIPFYNKYLLGNITGDHVLGIISSICAFPVLIIGYVLFVMDELNYLLFVVFLVILIIGFIVDHIIAYHFLSKRCKYASWLIVLSVFSCGFLRPIILFITKNYNQVSKS
ncbi:hypothetical protein [Catenibacterium mitsuokai]|uniref:hypothetical protein n=2 Tax=Catenibacterium mitsuokai TaxID=100886 RepID=UPI00058FF434|nr:hypothetical protein [Catenibacterium mitsuokai]MBT9814238.1 hypothetical protein [Catenibacterium mitsuokai]UWO54079.1 hypothetical protein NQ499_04405 [Catenibacterium mitsuokai]